VFKKETEYAVIVCIFCIPLAQTQSRMKVHGINEFLNWLLTGGYIESTTTLAIILVLVINVIYFNKLKRRMD
jgi:hypothetical protein